MLATVRLSSPDSWPGEQASRHGYLRSSPSNEHRLTELTPGEDIEQAVRKQTQPCMRRRKPRQPDQGWRVKLQLGVNLRGSCSPRGEGHIELAATAGRGSPLSKCGPGRVLASPSR